MLVKCDDMHVTGREPFVRTGYSRNASLYYLGVGASTFFLIRAAIIFAFHTGSAHNAFAAAFLAAFTLSLLAISLLLAVCFAAYSGSAHCAMDGELQTISIGLRI